MREKAHATFSDENCKARFGPDFEGECVPYPGTPGAKNKPTSPLLTCEHGLPQFRGCPACCTVLKEWANEVYADTDCCTAIISILNPGPF